MKKRTYFCLSFLIPVLIISIGFIICKIAPFGDKSLMAIDAWGQYFPMLREMRRAFLSGNLSYSFAGGLGFNLIAQSAYYTNSPLWLLLYIMPFDITPTGVDLIVLLRFGLAGLSFSIWLSEQFDEGSIRGVALSVAYALCGYALAFINQFMWMDIVLLTPFVMTGLLRLCNKKKPLLYIIALTTAIFSNFYIAYMLCIFCVLCFIAISIINFKGYKNLLFTGCRFAVASLISGILNLPILIPLVRAISRTVAVDSSFDYKPELYHSAKEMVMRFFPFQKVSLEYDAPNLYFGILCVTLVVFMFFIKNIPARAKIVSGALLAFLILSTNFNILDYIWHGFHFPNQLPARQSFLIAFVALTLACSALKELSAHKIFTFLLCCLIITEAALNTVHIFKNDVRTTNIHTSLLKLQDDIDEFKEYILPDFEKNEFFRSELKTCRDNGGQHYGYLGISYYSSTMSAKAYDFFQHLKLPIYARNVSVRYEYNPVFNALFGVKYIMSDTYISDELSSVVANSEKLYLIENKVLLPVAFVANKSVLNLNENYTGKAYLNEIFTKAADCDDVILSNGMVNTEELISAVEKLNASGIRITDISGAKISGTIDVKEDGVLFISLPYEDTQVKIDGKNVQEVEIAGYLCGAYISAGTRKIEIKLY
ncbi:MAG: YfhO family protein [Lachnospiraceae bacterium]|nr:YfhO family protein [Lachnospiraceae bacterium]